MHTNKNTYECVRAILCMWVLIKLLNKKQLGRYFSSKYDTLYKYIYTHINSHTHTNAQRDTYAFIHASMYMFPILHIYVSTGF